MIFFAGAIAGTGGRRKQAIMSANANLNFLIKKSVAGKGKNRKFPMSR
ncbi:hypothetical protein [Ureibacillus terrenus]|nr:hypothetical protein [Ureibacillus terrenus]MED3661206.1 hypothetical protein [Ureibacillus terrenus]MED3764319.1 hypothetical protein [Ureibacillus terrenus]